MKLHYLFLFAFLTACNIRAVAVLETEDAIYGQTTVSKIQKYDPKQKHLDVTESVMGTVNSDSLKALGEIINGKVVNPSPALP